VVPRTEHRVLDVRLLDSRNKETERGAEPDECYVFRRVAEPACPDLAIEVIWTSGGLNKLEVYKKLGVREVWHWRRGHIQIHLLRADRYAESAVREALAGIDVERLASFIDRPTTSQAISEYRAALRGE
jgi:Uma2 family endonuclease